MKPRSIQFFAPKILGPRTTLKISSRQVSTATGQRRETVERRSRSRTLRMKKITIPVTTQIH